MEDKWGRAKRRNRQEPSKCQRPGTAGQTLLPPRLMQAAPVPGSQALHAASKEEPSGPIQTHSPKGQVWATRPGLRVQRTPFEVKRSKWLLRNQISQLDFSPKSWLCQRQAVNGEQTLNKRSEGQRGSHSQRPSSSRPPLAESYATKPCAKEEGRRDPGLGAP